jgi:NAD(P)-dependent dehydrogenase (short-subunit alcohol dehydrogenase family)
MRSLEDEVVLITGDISGIGRTSAIPFAKEGAKVAITGPRLSEGEAVVSRWPASTAGFAASELRSWKNDGRQHPFERLPDVAFDGEEGGCREAS